jgi:YfiH family protein
MTSAPLPVIQSPRLAVLPGIRHAFFTRQGGVSTGIYEGLNVGRGSKDAPEDVIENRRRAAAWFGAPAEALNTCYQIHSARAVVAQGPWDAERPEGDAVATQVVGLVCGALAADCAPVLFADATARVVAAAHAGWQGALNGVVADTVERMVALGAQRDRIVAAVGPCIGPQSYEVGPEYVARFLAADPRHQSWFRPVSDSDRALFDLPGFVLSRLAEAGVVQSEWIGRDTCTEPDWFYSNRRAFKQGEPDYGRLLSAIMLEP